MKKTISIIIAVALIFAVFLIVKTNNDNKTAKSHEETILVLENIINTRESLAYLIDSNKAIIDMLQAEDYEKATEYGNQALSLISDAQMEIKNAIISPNFLEDGMQELQTNYKRTIEIVGNLSNASEQDLDEIKQLIEKGTYTHLDLLKCLQCFANLYSIRDFDSLPDKEAKKTLKETWWEFGFEDSIECPKKIDEKELYIIWAEQFSGGKVSQDMIDKIETLRKNDDLASKEYNKKWLELVREICGTDTLE